jgi:hypothetical protein
MNPYILMPPKMQEVSGLQPVFQNFGQQQANQQAALAQQNQLVNQAGQMQGGGGMNQLAMAAMLRKGSKPTQDEINAKDAQMGGMGTFNPFTQYDISQQYGTDMYSPQSRMLAGQELGMK